ncbi:MAG: hypothetical protein QOC66_2672, partial [Pseudonocardiales bacterium]|nr:hypothetical protein [Pseudonocardiales bacterium]
ATGPGCRADSNQTVSYSECNYLRLSQDATVCQR